MEDIIGFDEQIGFLNPFRRAKKLVQKTQQRNTAIAKRIAKGMPIPAKTKAAIIKRQKTGKALPPSIKRALSFRRFF